MIQIHIFITDSLNYKWRLYANSKTYGVGYAPSVEQAKQQALNEWEQLKKLVPSNTSLNVPFERIEFTGLK